MERVLYLWAVRHPASGYVQGINDIATPIYAVMMEPFASLHSTEIKAEEDTLMAVEADVFWCLTKLLDEIQVRPWFPRGSLKPLASLPSFPSHVPVLPLSAMLVCSAAALRSLLRLVTSLSRSARRPGPLHVRAAGHPEDDVPFAGVGPPGGR